MSEQEVPDQSLVGQGSLHNDNDSGVEPLESGDSTDRYPTRFKKGKPAFFKGYVFSDDPDAGRFTPEKRVALKYKKKIASRIKHPEWTEEKRAAARARIIARNAKAKDEHERMKRRTATRYLRKKGTEELYVWTPVLAKRPDMEEVEKQEADT